METLESIATECFIFLNFTGIKLAAISHIIIPYLVILCTCFSNGLRKYSSWHELGMVYGIVGGAIMMLTAHVQCRE